MSFPLFDEVNLPPGSTMVDVNKVPLDYGDGRLAYQAVALQEYLDATEENPLIGHDWNAEEGIFVVVEDPTVVTDDVLVSGEVIGIVVVLDPE